MKIKKLSNIGIQNGFNLNGGDFDSFSKNYNKKDLISINDFNKN